MDRKTIEGWTLKRLAWAFGCAKKDSLEEAQLEEALLLRVMENRGVHATIPEQPDSQNLE